ncbi:MAG: OsmC family protein [Verrucomicrobiales bacterium]|nr:OsmC family protein [Verrucomicrobiales bacterium]
MTTTATTRSSSTNTATTTIPSRPIVRNGVNVTKLAETIQAIGQQPELAQFKFRARNRWDTGGHNQATVDTFYGTCHEMTHKQPFKMDADEPAVLLGEDNGANPVEFVLAGLSGCMTTTLAYHAAGRGLNLESIESEYEGDIDLHGLLDLDPNVRSGYREIRVKFRVKGDADVATIQELVRKSPVFDTLAQPVKINVQVEKV